MQRLTRRTTGSAKKTGTLMASDLRKWIDSLEPPTITIEAIDFGDEVSFQVLREGKWIDGRYPRNIRIDRDTHFDTVDTMSMHAHVYGRRDRDNALIVVRQSGSSSHSQPGKLHQKDADALRRRGFNIALNNIVEWVELTSAERVFLTESFHSY